jgi:hypothetical protein
MGNWLVLGQILERIGELIRAYRNGGDYPVNAGQ